MDTQKQLLAYRFRRGTNGSDVLLPSPLLLLPCHEQLRLISSYCFMRRAKCRFASLLFLSRLLSVTSNLSLQGVCISLCVATTDYTDREHLDVFLVQPTMSFESLETRDIALYRPSR